MGIAQFYPEQEQVIADALGGRDELVVLPTGYGKSACYQVPSMILPKPVVLISPLLALLRDQHEKLKQRYQGLWHREAKPYSLDRILARYDKLIGHYDKIIDALVQAQTAPADHRPLPSAEDVGLVVP